MSACSCECIGYEDDGDCTFCSERVVTARKYRQCEGCLGSIRNGQQAVEVFGKWDGDIYRHSYHKVCLDALKAAANKAGTGWYYGCSILDCLTGLLDDAVWPRDREVIEMVSEVFKHSEDEYVATARKERP